jgi:hypothetical protein
VAIDQETSPAATDLNPNPPAIENEIPTYRAVSTTAVVAVLCGLMAMFSFAHPFFYVFAALAVVLGVTADRKIQRYPDVLTGQTIARVGVLLGLVFGLSIATITTLQNYLIRREAVKFAKHYGERLKEAPLVELYWLGLPPSTRQKITADENWAQLQAAGSQEQAMDEMTKAPLKSLSERLKSSEAPKIAFRNVEFQGQDNDNQPLILAVYELDGPPDKTHEAKELAAIVFKGMVPEGSKIYEWWADEVRYPYNPATYEPPVKPVDDGHGHAH